MHRRGDRLGLPTPSHVTTTSEAPGSLIVEGPTESCVGNIAASSTSATAEPHVALPAIEQAAAASLRNIRRTAIRLSDLAIEATELDERAQALADGEQEVERARSNLVQAVAANEIATAELERREAELAEDAQRVQGEVELLERRKALLERVERELDERARVLEARESRLHWRWLWKAWKWRPPLPGRGARVCDFLFVPSPDGYKLIEQDGVALQPGAKLTGLLSETASFVVSKIAPLPFDGRWCAYLQQTNSRRGADDDRDRGALAAHGHR